MRLQRAGDRGHGPGGGDGAFREVRKGIEQGGDEHVAGDAAERIEMDVFQGRMFFSEEKNQKTFASGARG
jgi:hypothetical protein